MTKHLVDPNLPLIPQLDCAYANLQWYPSDTEKLWRKNCKKYGKSWKYYNDTSINYSLNSLGYRGNDVSTIKDNNYFISLGCSHTMGIGLALEDTYSDRLSKKLNMNYLNCGLGGSSTNLLWANSIRLVKNLKILPKFVVLQWPSINRLTIFKTGTIKTFVPNHYLFSDNYIESRLFESYIMSKDFSYNQTQLYFDSVNLLWNFAKVKTINFTLDDDVFDLLKIDQLLKFVDNSDYNSFARDVGHYGKNHHKVIADFIESKL